MSLVVKALDQDVVEMSSRQEEAREARKETSERRDERIWSVNALMPVCLYAFTSLSFRFRQSEVDDMMVICSLVYGVLCSRESRVESRVSSVECTLYVVCSL